ncbi:bifunctional diguanylate cyclase/phosphodiesterase [Plasticicumulans acidivorans]|uniref:cyclic-guanylate-specific phosphodiesterase n=1 Tax=Plasticicumulans acidivorans TaxID=886464 RepID=A0A317MY58_9GAMM|nr:EAL domain-containing protein [Plasticicumulans acidivorans]PWV64371.1 diguanylate cyclase/phosphodiesterase with PAS/PAC and GAF sensor(s) [Plasticicumulans acidivorans]
MSENNSNLRSQRAARVSTDEVSACALSSEEQGKLLHLQQTILESVVCGADHHEVIDQVCRLAEGLLPRSVGSVMLLDSAREALNVYAAPSLPPQGWSRLNGMRPGPGAGSCGNAVFRQEPQFVSNTFQDPRWSDLRQLAYDFNLCACWSVPIYALDRKVVGTFALSSFENRAPSVFHQQLLEVGASIIGIVLERKRSRESLRLYQKVLEGSGEGVMITDAEERILLVNKAFSRIFGYESEDIVGDTPRCLSSGQHERAFYEAMWESLRLFGHWRGEIWNRRRNGEVFPEWLSIAAVRTEDGQITHYIGTFSDITERKSAEARIEFLSSHDALTGLPNRELFREQLEAAIGLAESNGGKLALLQINLDNFRFLNDSLGHAASDRILTILAARLRQAVAAGDLLCRKGGDEFLLALTQVADTEALNAAVEALLAQLATPVSCADGSWSLSASVGIALFPDDGHGFETLSRCADTALRHAKDAGRNTYRYFTERLNSDGIEYLRITQGLRNALSGGQLVLHYQPQIDLASGALIGAEALIRWQHPGDGLLSPDRFIRIAEKTGLIVEIGNWVLHEACRQAQAWRQAGHAAMTVAVNVSAIQFRRGGIEQAVRAALEASGLAPECLELELTESVLLGGAGNMSAVFERLKDLGVKLSIDDFGTGYSSLAYLKRLRIDRLKIDQSFIRDVVDDGNDAAIVCAIIEMARALNLRTIAEGVETAAQRSFLLEHHCDESQGYFYARPLPPEQFAAFAWPQP